ncbi:MAG: hypothetical protein AAF959_24465 [Cyanobacteria bacterium P01_D01_bin.56]
MLRVSAEMLMAKSLICIFLSSVPNKTSAVDGLTPSWEKEKSYVGTLDFCSRISDVAMLHLI